jgi:hypothetical protein
MHEVSQSAVAMTDWLLFLAVWAVWITIFSLACRNWMRTYQTPPDARMVNHLRRRYPVDGET